MKTLGNHGEKNCFSLESRDNGIVNHQLLGMNPNSKKSPTVSNSTSNLPRGPLVRSHSIFDGPIHQDDLDFEHSEVKKVHPKC